MRKNKLIRFFFNKFYKFKLPPMVKYWQTGDSARAKLVTMKDGAYAMIIEGEKHPLYGFPRGPVLFGPLARLKFLAKNLVFNEVWRRLEIGQSEKEIFTYLFEDVRPILKGEIQGMKYDMFPPERLCPAVRELWRGMTAVEGRIKNPQEREDAVQKFQKDDNCRVFVGTMKVAGMGITLTASHHMIFAEMDWTPSVLTQAEDRCHRIGQEYSLLVQHLVVDGSMDAFMSHKIIRKQKSISKALNKTRVKGDWK